MSYFGALTSVKKIQVFPKTLWRLNEELVYVSDTVGVIRVPKDFITDFGSVPRLPFVFLAAGARADEACIVHDWLYSTQIMPRDVADEVLAEAVKALGYSEALAKLMWAGVRLGGWAAWKKPNVPQESHVTAIMGAASLEAP
jgi:hypothetical protein